ncbi:MAG: class I SAM-dependent methyltransferase [Leptospirales bacterium]|nr:class I SAM-dependent methyltransferase [Leptospirales bacterium]
MKANMASQTAVVVAAGTVITSREPRFQNLVTESARRFAQDFVRAARPGSMLPALIEQRWFRNVMSLVQSVTIPGLFRHHILRKAFIERQARLSLQEGIRSFVVVGAGFDSLALRLAPEFPGVQFVELDHPATQRVKRRALGSFPENLRFESVDLGSELPTPEVATPALTIVEGVLMYIPLETVEKILRHIGQSQGALIFTFMERLTVGRIGFYNQTWLADLWLKRKSEPFKWDASQTEIEAILVEAGFTRIEFWNSEKYHAAFGHGDGLARGETICIART